MSITMLLVNEVPSTNLAVPCVPTRDSPEVATVCNHTAPPAHRCKNQQEEKTGGFKMKRRETDREPPHELPPEKADSVYCISVPLPELHRWVAVLL